MKLVYRQFYLVMILGAFAAFIPLQIIVKVGSTMNSAHPLMHLGEFESLGFVTFALIFAILSLLMATNQYVEQVQQGMDSATAMQKQLDEMEKHTRMMLESLELQRLASKAEPVVNLIKIW